MVDESQQWAPTSEHVLVARALLVRIVQQKPDCRMWGQLGDKLREADERAASLRRETVPDATDAAFEAILFVTSDLWVVQSRCDMTFDHKVRSYSVLRCASVVSSVVQSHQAMSPEEFASEVLLEAVSFTLWHKSDAAGVKALLYLEVFHASPGKNRLYLNDERCEQALQAWMMFERHGHVCKVYKSQGSQPAKRVGFQDDANTDHRTHMFLRRE